jgi:DNA mismatch endonuclease (patch repair protein)
MPRDNRLYWQRKIARNIRRDRETARRLKEAGWRVLRVWEHALRSPESVVRRITSGLATQLPKSEVEKTAQSEHKSLREV